MPQIRRVKKELLENERQRIRNTTDENALRKELARFNIQRLKNATDEKTIRKESAEVKREGIRNATDEKAVGKESVRVNSQRIRNATGEKTLRKELIEVKRQRIIVDKQELGKRSTVHSESRPRYNKTQDDIKQQHVEEGKADFKIDSEIKSETGRERDRSLQTRARYFHQR